MKLFPKILLLFIGLTGSLSAYSQNIRIKWGEEIREAPKSWISKIIRSDKDGLFVLRQQDSGIFGGPLRTYYLEKFDRRLSHIYTRELQLLPEFKNRSDISFQTLHYLKGNFHVYSSFYNRAADKKTAFVQFYNKEGKAIGKSLNIDQIEASRRRNSGNFEFTYSIDTSKILVFRNEPFAKGEPERFACKVYDNNFQLIWSKSIELPYEDQVFSVQRFRVDNDGNIYVLGKAYKGKVPREQRNGNPNFRYVILHYFNSGAAFKEYTITLGENFITDITFKVNANNDIIGAGFFSKTRSYNINGTFYLLIDGQSKEVKTQSTKEFPVSFLSEFLNARQVRKERGLFEYDLDEIILRNDGGALLIAEQFIVRAVTTNDNRGFARTNYYFYYNDIIVTNISPTGTIDWYLKIPKEQISTNDGGFYSSYARAVVKDKIYFIFNDHPKNLSLEKNFPIRALRNVKKALTMVVMVNNDGTLRKQALFPAKEKKTITRPKISTQVAANEMIIFGERGKNIRFGKLNFE